MIWRILLLVLALFLLTACTGTRDKGTYSYDPCHQMRVEAEEVHGLERQVRALKNQAYPEPTLNSVPDTVETISAESLLVQKENLLSMSVQSMQQTAQDCAARSRPYDREQAAP